MTFTPSEQVQFAEAHTRNRSAAWVSARGCFVWLLFASLAVNTAVAAVNPTVPPDVSYVAGSTRKIEQLIGNTDSQTLAPTLNRTGARYGITGSDVGVPFTHKGITHVAFGDTYGGGVFGDRDPLAFTTDTDPEDVLFLYFTMSTWNPYVTVLMKTDLQVNNAPAIVVPPTDQRMAEGETAVFQVTASAIGTLGYRWQRDATNIPGATSNVFTLEPATATDDGASFRCVVSNASGSVTSNPARLRIAGNNTAPSPEILRCAT